MSAYFTKYFETHRPKQRVYGLLPEASTTPTPTGTKVEHVLAPQYAGCWRKRPTDRLHRKRMRLFPNAGTSLSFRIFYVMREE